MAKMIVTAPAEPVGYLPAKQVTLGTKQAILRLESARHRDHLKEDGSGFIWGQLILGRSALLAKMYRFDRRWAAWLRDYHHRDWDAAALLVRLYLWDTNNLKEATVSSVLLLEGTRGAHAYPWMQEQWVEKETFEKALQGTIGQAWEMDGYEPPFTPTR